MGPRSGVDSTAFGGWRQRHAEVTTRTLAALIGGVAALLACAALVLAVSAPDAGDLRARAGRVQSAQVIGRSAARGSPFEELRIASTSGLEARCAVRGPAAGVAPTERHPGFLLVAGYETGRVAVAFPETADVVLVACDYPFRIPERLDARSFWTALPRLRTGVLDTPPTLLLALDYLASRADVDPAAIGVVGASVGVPPATVAAALDPRARAVALLYGGGDLPLLFAHNVDLGAGWMNGLARAAVGLVARPIEPTRYAGSIAPRPTLVVNARNDPFIPRGSALALHRALREPKEIRWVDLDHFAAFHERDLLAQVTAIALEWFGRRGLLSARASAPSHP